MKAIVTGGAGFIGSHLVDLLAARGDEVTVIDDRRTAVVDGFPYRNVRDVRLPVHRAELPTSDVIYHLASPIGSVSVVRLAGTIAEEILRDAATVRDAALHSGATLVYAGTSEEYGPQPAGPIPETARRVIVPGNSGRMEYAVAKIAAETMLLNTAGLDVRIVRPFNVVGARQNAHTGFVVPRFIDQALAGRPLTVYTPGTQLRAYTHVLDIVDGFVLAAERGYPGGVWNLGDTRNECDVLTLAHEVIETTGSRSRIETVDPRDLWGPGYVDSPDKVADGRLAMTELGWAPQFIRQDAIRHAVEALGVAA